MFEEAVLEETRETLRIMGIEINLGQITQIMKTLKENCQVETTIMLQN